MLRSILSTALPLMGISQQATNPISRGFNTSNSASTERFKAIGRNFVDGFYQSLRAKDNTTLIQALESSRLEYQGFSFEGAAMAQTLLDALTITSRRRPHSASKIFHGRFTYTAHVGAGWAAARLPWGIAYLRNAKWLNPLLKWLAWDGYGFHSAYFHHESPRFPHRWCRKLRGYERHAFHQGVGRCLWFISGANPDEIERRITRFPANFQSDLWSGSALAAVYAGSAKEEALKTLLAQPSASYPAIAQGACFAAKAIVRGGTATEGTISACKILTSFPLEEAAIITDISLENLPQGTKSNPNYAIWRSRVAAHFGDSAIAPSAA